MKKILFIVLCVLVVIAPTAALFGYYYFSGGGDDQSVIRSELVSAQFINEDGSVEEYTAGQAKMKAFVELLGDEENKPVLLTALPQEALSYVGYRVLYTDSFDVKSEFRYYVSSDKAKCYFVGENDQAYRIPSLCAERFLNGEFGERVYASSAAPVVSLSGTPLTPTNLEWKYKTVGGELRRASCSYENKDYSSSVDSFDATLGIDADKTPDEIRLVIKNSETGVRLFSGSSQVLAKTVFDGSVPVNVQMTLIWRESDDVSYAGSAEYLFSGRLLGTPAFSFSANTVHCGEVVILSAYNVSDPSSISIECTPEFDFDFRFYKVGDSYQALVPIPAELTDRLTEYTFTATSSSAKDELVLTVAPLQKSDYDYYVPGGGDYYNEASINALKSSILPILKTRSDFSFEGGKFKIPAVDNYVSATSNYQFGAKVNIINLSKSYLAWDNMYCAQTRKINDIYVEGNVTQVVAAFSGKVVYVGAQTFTGRMVIIDHGSGLMTWYTNLSSDIAVHYGDEVETGQFIAHAADGGFNAQLNFNFHVGAAVNGVPVALSQLIEHGLIAYR